MIRSTIAAVVLALLAGLLVGCGPQKSAHIGDPNSSSSLTVSVDRNCSKKPTTLFIIVITNNGNGSVPFRLRFGTNGNYAKGVLSAKEWREFDITDKNPERSVWIAVHSGNATAYNQDNIQPCSG